MVAFWDGYTNKFSRSFGHVPQPWEHDIEWEVYGCWNCGGEFLVERYGTEGHFETEICGCCDGNGEIEYSVELYPWNNDWFEHPEYWTFKFIQGFSNVFRSFGLF